MAEEIVQGALPLAKTLYLRLHRPILRFFANRGFSPEDSRDLMQETFVRVVRGAERLGALDDAEAWVFAIARNLWRQESRRLQRQRRRVVEVPLEQPVAEAQVGDDLDVLDLLLDEERLALLDKAIAQLPLRMRACVSMRRRGYSQLQIATVLAVSEGTVKSQLFDARKKLQQSMRELQVLPPVEAG